MARLLWLLAVVALAAGLAVFEGGGTTKVAYAIGCDNFPIQLAAQTFLEAVGEDPDQLDGANDNGIACEDLPCPCDNEPITELIGDYVPPTNTPVNTPTNTAVPTQSSSGGGGSQATSTPTATQVTNAAAATATSVAATSTTAAATATATATVAPPPSTQSITPPATGDAGLR